jgi:hypothetical protein
MDDALNVLTAVVGAFAVWALWMLILVVVPGFLALYVARLFPLTGEWRKRLRATFPPRSGESKAELIRTSPRLRYH